MINEKEIYLELNDGEWESCYPIHDRTIARAIAFDEEGYFYFVGVDRDDDFGKAAYIETAGGGVEDGEDLEVAICRELSEELGASVEVICRIGVVSDYYNRINRHNINNYFLCKVKSFGESHMTKEEISEYHLKTVKLSFEDAISEYERGRETKIGRLVYNREMPILKRAKEIIDAKLYL
jgi:8-oxo-dGTP pyrophosphatase MutT (NUDIX family)